jgi:hypothetical protein
MTPIPFPSKLTIGVTLGPLIANRDDKRRLSIPGMERPEIVEPINDLRFADAILAACIVGVCFE